MSHENYSVIFDGEIVEGSTVETVKAQLEKLTKVDMNKASALFSGKKILLKKVTDRAAAKKYGKTLDADVITRVIKTDTTTAAPQRKLPLLYYRKPIHNF